MKAANTQGASASAGASSFLGSPKSDPDTSRDLTNSNKSVDTSRVIFILTLCVVAAGLGYGAHVLLEGAESRLAQEQFEAIVDRALQLSQEIATRRRHGIITVASIAAETFPDAHEWPFIYFKGYANIATNVIETSNGRDIGLMPLVTPELLTAFEDFAYDVVFPQSQFPNTTAMSPFGRGVFGLDPTKELAQQKYPIAGTNGTTTWGSPYSFSFPYLYHSSGPAVVLMGDMHSTAGRGMHLDNMYTCSQERARRHLALLPEEGTEQNLSDCSILTDILALNGGTNAHVKTGPSAVIFAPIYPANNNTIMAGALTSVIVWDETLMNVFSNEVSGVDCVLQTETQLFTYEVTQGIANLKGEGDLHDPKFDDYYQSVPLNPPGVYSNYSAHYTLTLYPNQAFFEVYHTRNVMYATVGTVLIIVLTSTLFFLFDFFVRKEFNNKHLMAEAKRQYVRYISHEVRTPLNTVSMGLQLLLGEFSSYSKNQVAVESSLQQLPTNEGGSTWEEEKLALRSKLEEWSGLSQDVLRSCQSAVDVLSDILNYDKVKSRTLHLELSVIPRAAHDLIERTTSEFKLQACMSNVEYVVDLDPSRSIENDTTSAPKPPANQVEQQVVGDSSRIAQILRNLISNALKFTPDGGKVTVQATRVKTPEDSVDEITLHNGGQTSFHRRYCLEVSVTDTGAGMTQEQLKTVFCEGTQFDVNKLQAGKGSGLGLFIAKGIVEQHGGTLTVTSEGLGHGTTFTMTLPLYDAPSDQAPLKHAPVSDQASTLSALNRSLHLLVVDDAAMNRKLLVRLLQQRGHTASEAEDGLVAIQRVKDVMKEGMRFDSILMDYEMPHCDGPTATKEIRALGCDAFIVGVTGHLFNEQVSYFYSCGANQVLPKPLNMQALTDIWEEYGVSNHAPGAHLIPSEFGKTNIKNAS